MSKIEKAIERAKEMRHKGQQETQAQVRADVGRLQDKEPVYTETKVISLDRAHLEKQRLMTLVEDPEAIDCYNLLRTQLLERTRHKGHNTIMITSTRASAKPRLLNWLAVTLCDRPR